jgi:methylenetetrahydrofolate dehydrogenase (NADP+)/methenyltetrahydrofolate cyclohydrolase
MKSNIIDGRAIAKWIKKDLCSMVDKLIENNRHPRMAVLHIGKDPGSLSYTKSIKKTASTLNIDVQIYEMEKTVDTKEVIQKIEKLNQSSEIGGILIQEPIPDNFDRENIITTLSPVKDIDCMNPLNMGSIMRGEYTFAPSTPLGVLKILDYENIDTEGKHVVIIGRSNIVGKPLANLLLIKKSGGNATVTVCHSRTRDITTFSKMADILIVAIGNAGFVKGNMVKEGSVVIDVGINYVKDEEGKYTLTGDVDFDSVDGIASYLTPVPGGVGPVTTMMLLSNLIKAVYLQQ